MQMNVNFGVDQIILTVKLTQEAGIYCMCSGENGLHVQEIRLTNGNPVRKIPTRILFLPLNNPGSFALCLCIPQGIPGLGLPSKGLHFIFSFTSQNQKQHEGSCCHQFLRFLEGLSDLDIRMHYQNLHSSRSFLCLSGDLLSVSTSNSVLGQLLPGEDTGFPACLGWSRSTGERNICPMSKRQMNKLTLTLDPVKAQEKPWLK